MLCEQKMVILKVKEAAGILKKNVIKEKQSR